MACVWPTRRASDGYTIESIRAARTARLGTSNGFRRPWVTSHVRPVCRNFTSKRPACKLLAVLRRKSVKEHDGNEALEIMDESIP